MKKRFSKLIIIFLIFTSSYKFSYATVQTKIIADVENEMISSYELKNKIRTILILNNETLNQSNINKTKSLALKSLIDVKLKKNELKKLNYLQENANVNNYVKRIAKSYNLDTNSFKKIFINNDLDYKLYIDEINTELNWQQLIISIYGEKSIIDEKEVDEELKKVLISQQNLFEYKLSEIEVRAENFNEIKTIINELKDQINLIGFQNAAIKYSISTTSLDGGNLGWINSKSLSKKILNEIQNIEKGQITNPIIQKNSVLILKLEDIKKLNIDESNLETVREKIIMQKKGELLDLYSSSHLSKIKNNAYIELK